MINSKEFFYTKTVVNQNNLVTVCEEANCPNITECWSKRHATFMIMGDSCRSDNIPYDGLHPYRESINVDRKRHNIYGI